MKKHILSKYAEKKDLNTLFACKRNTTETKVLNADTLGGKRTVKTFAVENSDSDEISNFAKTSEETDATETIESSDFANFQKLSFNSEKTYTTMSIENLDKGRCFFDFDNKKTRLTATIETSD